MLLASRSISSTYPLQIAIQEQTPDWIKGRVLALQLVLYNACSIPVILGIGGIADKYGIQNVTSVAVCIILFGLWGQYYERKPHRWQPPDQKVQIHRIRRTRRILQHNKRMIVT